jgi:hypothetical protein
MKAGAGAAGDRTEKREGHGTRHLETGRGHRRGARRRDTAKLARVSDGSTKPAKGDRLVVPETLTGNVPCARLESFEIKGEKVTEPYEPDTDMVLAWLQRELAASGRFMMLPPASQQAAFDEADVTLASGEFKLGDTNELLSPTFPQPDVLVKARLGLVRLTRTPRTYKNELKFEVGMELQFFNTDGSEYLLPSGKNRIGGITDLEMDQVLDQGRVVQGVPDEEFQQVFNECLALWMKKLTGELEAPGQTMSTVSLYLQDEIALLKLNRPATRNAIDDVLVAELKDPVSRSWKATRPCAP